MSIEDPFQPDDDIGITLKEAQQAKIINEFRLIFKTLTHPTPSSLPLIFDASSEYKPKKPKRFDYVEFDYSYASCKDDY